MPVTVQLPLPPDAINDPSEHQIPRFFPSPLMLSLGLVVPSVIPAPRPARPAKPVSAARAVALFAVAANDRIREVVPFFLYKLSALWNSKLYPLGS